MILASFIKFSPLPMKFGLQYLGGRFLTNKLLCFSPCCHFLHVQFRFWANIDTCLFIFIDDVGGNSFINDLGKNGWFTCLFGCFGLLYLIRQNSSARGKFLLNDYGRIFFGYYRPVLYYLTCMCTVLQHQSGIKTLAKYCLNLSVCWWHVDLWHIT